MIQNANNVIEINQVSKSVYIKEENFSDVWGKFKQLFFNIGYKRFDILKDVNVQVPHLTTLGIIGRNGSGKSSLLKLIAGISQPSEGHIKSRGQIAAILDIGSGFHPELTGRENITFYGKIIGMSNKAIREKSSEIIDFSELEDTFIDMPVKYYSNGMYLRLAFSIAVHSDVDIILFDEVLTVGDSSFNIKCFQKINEIKKKTTIVLVSHDMEDITRVCDICIWLDEGKVVEVGNPAHVVGKYIEHTILKKDISDINSEFKFNVFKQNDIAISDFQLTDIERNMLKEADYNQDFYLQFVLDINKETPIDLIPTLQIIDQNNNNILFSASVFQGPPFLLCRGNGRHQISCFFPKKVLNKGLYRVTLYLFDTNQNVLLEAINIYAFRVKISDNDLNHYLKNTSFSITPALKWEFESKDIGLN